MAYTNAWTDNVPLGGESANLADDYLRRLRLDIKERMNDLVNDWTADPVKLKDVLSGVKVGKRLIIPFIDFIASNPEDSSYTTNGQLTPDSDGETLYASLSSIIPVGATITSVEILMETSSTVNWLVVKRAFVAGANPTTTTLATTEHTASADFKVTTTPSSGAGALTPYVVNETELVYIKIPAGTDVTIIAARVTYNTPRIDA